VFGGSFNPIHFGHLLLADEIREALDLDRMLFVPAAQPPHKPASDLAPAPHRFQMTALAVREHPRFDFFAVGAHFGKRRPVDFEPHDSPPRFVAKRLRGQALRESTQRGLVFRAEVAE